MDFERAKLLFDVLTASSAYGPQFANIASAARKELAEINNDTPAELAPKPKPVPVPAAKAVPATPETPRRI